MAISKSFKYFFYILFLLGIGMFFVFGNICACGFSDQTKAWTDLQNVTEAIQFAYDDNNCPKEGLNIRECVDTNEWSENRLKNLRLENREYYYAEYDGVIKACTPESRKKYLDSNSMFVENHNEEQMLCNVLEDYSEEELKEIPVEFFGKI